MPKEPETARAGRYHAASDAASPPLSADQWARVSLLFEALIDAPAEAARSRIDASDLEADAKSFLRKMMLASAGKSILDQTVDRLAERLLDVDSSQASCMPEDLIGRTFGHWRVTRELARGGMGAVYEARRADGQFEKSVALKVIRPGAYSTHTAKRFADEMRTLARLEHPNIARLVDGGISSDDISYFAMELVEGLTVTQFADRHRLDLPARVDLLLQVCTAVEHAHRNLVVHGDLKPSNILVNESAQVRLLDFGIAQSLQPREGDPVLPRFTLRYAAPEQILAERLTTSCDVFGLSAVLFELCCGSAPREDELELVSTDYRALLARRLEPAFRRFESAPDRAAIAERRRSTPTALRKSLAGDIHWILAKGLDADPAKRLSNVAELRAELTRWRAGMAVDSHPAGAGYRLRRWWGRHRIPASIAAAAALGLLLAGASVWRQSHIAASEAAKAQWSKEFLLSIFRQADPVLNQQQPITVNELTGGAAAKLLGDPARFDVDLQMEAAAVLGEVQSNLGQFDSALALSQRRLQLARDGADRRVLSAALLAHGEALAALDQLQSAIAASREALSLVPLDRSVDPLAVSAAQQLAMLLARVSEYDEAQRLVDELLSWQRRIADSPDGDRALSLVYSTQSTIDRELGNTEQALSSVNQALAYARRTGEHTRTYVDALTSLAALRYSMGDAAATAEVDQQVVELFEKLYGSDHPLTLKAQSELAVSLSQLGDMTRALELNTVVLSGYRKRLGEENQYVAGALANMGASERALGRLDRSLEHYDQSLAIWNRLSSAPPMSLAATLLAHGRLLIELRRFDAAEGSFLHAVSLIEKTLGREHIFFHRAQAYYAPVLIETGRIDAAASALEPAYERLLEEYGADSTRTSIATVTLAQLREAQGDAPEAHRLAQQAIDVLDVEGIRQRHAIELDKAKQIHERTSSR